jgi:hypothetical protein
MVVLMVDHFEYCPGEDDEVDAVEYDRQDEDSQECYIFLIILSVSNSSILLCVERQELEQECEGEDETEPKDYQKEGNSKLPRHSVVLIISQVLPVNIRRLGSLQDIPVIHLQCPLSCSISCLVELLILLHSLCDFHVMV